MTLCAMTLGMRSFKPIILKLGYENIWQAVKRSTYGWFL